MKRITEILIAASVVLLAMSCKEDRPENDTAPTFVYLKNQSGHTITFTHDPQCIELPEPFILPDGETYSLWGQVVHPEGLPFFWGDKEFINRNIFYDERWFLTARWMPTERDFTTLSDYTFEAPSTWTFTFTKEDYEHAIQHGGDITEEPGEPIYAPYELRNQSGHVVSIVHKPSCYEFPDSLVLHNGDDKIFEHNSRSPFFYKKDFEKQLVYYDGRYVMEIEELPIGYKFNHRSEYVFVNTTETGERYRGACIYRFTEKDYEYAVAHGKDLGPAQ